jgi:hypothetical protein
VDGVTWTQLAPAQCIAMAATARAGLGCDRARQSRRLTAPLLRIVTLSTLSGYEAWRYQYFNAAQLTDAAVSGPLADANTDGVQNLLAYAAASIRGPSRRPQTAAFQPLQTRTAISRSLSPDSRTRPTSPTLSRFRAISRRGTPGLPIQRKWASTSLDATREKVTVRDNVLISGTSRRAIRLRVQMQP